MSCQQGELDHYERRWSRLNLSIPICVLVQRPDRLHIVSGRGTQLSKGGVALYAAFELDIGERVQVEFPDPESGPPLRIGAVVRNRAGYAYGLQFLLEPAPEAAV